MEAIYKRRSMRKFTKEMVTDAQMQQLIRAGFAAPSAKNSHEWVFIVIRDEAIFDGFIETHPGAFPLKTCGGAILVCADLSKELAPGHGWWIQDCAAAVENILLEATDMGLGSLWIGVHPMQDRIDSIKKLCALPEGIEPLGLVALGVSAKEKEGNDRYLEDMIYMNTYGQKWEPEA